MLSAALRVFLVASLAAVLAAVAGGFFALLLNRRLGRRFALRVRLATRRVAGWFVDDRLLVPRTWKIRERRQDFLVRISIGLRQLQLVHIDGDVVELR